VTGNVLRKVTLKGVRVTLLPWKSIKYYIFWVCVFGLNYPSCNANAPYFIVLCGLSSCAMFFFHIFTKRHDFRGTKLLDI